MQFSVIFSISSNLFENPVGITCSKLTIETREQGMKYVQI